MPLGSPLGTIWGQFVPVLGKMARATEPLHHQRLAVILVVHLRLLRTATLAWSSRDLAAAQRNPGVVARVLTFLRLGRELAVLRPRGAHVRGVTGLAIPLPGPV